MDIDDLLEDIDLIEVIDDALVDKSIPRVVPDRSNPLERLSSYEIQMQYRFSPTVIHDVLLPLIVPRLLTDSQRGCPLPPLFMLLIALRYYATGDLQRSTGYIENVTQPTVSVAIKKVSQVLTEHLQTFIKFPPVEQRPIVQQQFEQIRGFPCVIGCIDGTHIPITCPDHNRGEIYRNRKGRFTINVQVIGGPNMEMFDIVARWPGSAHDSRIFNNSQVKEAFESNFIEGILLGDSGYPQLRYLFTPVPEPQMPQRPALVSDDPNYILHMFTYREELRNYRAQTRYNRAHKSTRNTVERLFGLWKRRFLCLKYDMSLKLETTLRVITATAVLHNVAIQTKDDIEFPDVEIDDEPVQPYLGNSADAIALRNQFIIQNFTL